MRWISGAPADDYALVGHQAQTVYDPADANPAWLPIATAFDGGTTAQPTRNFNLGFKTHYDFAGYSDGRELRSTNGGTTYTSPVDNEVVEAATRRNDGKIIGPLFKGQAHANPPAPQFTMRMRIADADDPNVGTDMTAHVDISPLNFFHPTNQFFPTAIVQVPHGPLLMAGYSGLLDSDGGERFSPYLLQSTDGGANWTLRSRIAASTDTYKFSEVGMALDRNGELLVAYRDDLYSNLYLRRSTDLGRTWTMPEPINLAQGQHFPARIMPKLELLPNGMLALESGRVDNWVAVSFAGDGRVWDRTYRFYHNHYAAEPSNMNEGSSGNGAVVVAESNRIATFADSCHAVYLDDTGKYYNKCTWHNHEMTDTQEYMLKSSLIDVLTPGTGKIDLASKLRSGDVTVRSNLGAIDGSARTGAAAAFDGSTDPWSSAIRAGAGSGAYEIDLDRTYTLSKVGLSLALGGTEEAKVQTRRNPNDAWTTWYDAGPQKDFSLQYSPESLETVRARHVRIVTGSASHCPTGVSTPCSAIGEVELYSSDVNSFENDPVNALPRGWTAKETIEENGTGHIGVWVSKCAPGCETSRALRIADSSTEHLPTVRQDTGASETKTLGFRFKADQWRPAGTGVPQSMFLFDIRAGSSAAYHLGIAANGAIHWYDGKAWSVVGDVKADPNAWSTIRVNASRSAATITVNGERVGEVSRSDNATTSLTGHQYSASSTDWADESFLVDEVYTLNE